MISKSFATLPRIKIKTQTAQEFQESFRVFTWNNGLSLWSKSTQYPSSEIHGNPFFLPGRWVGGCFRHKRSMESLPDKQVTKRFSSSIGFSIPLLMIFGDAFKVPDGEKIGCKMGGGFKIDQQQTSKNLAIWIQQKHLLVWLRTSQWKLCCFCCENVGHLASSRRVRLDDSRWQCLKNGSWYQLCVGCILFPWRAEKKRGSYQEEICRQTFLTDYVKLSILWLVRTVTWTL